jgi:toxin ParE1/3/4
LAENPNLGTRCDDVREGYRRYRIGRHMAYYRIREFGVSVIRVLHERMLSTRHL